MNNFCTGYVLKLADKVSPYALSERDSKALKAKVEDIVQGRPAWKSREEDLIGSALRAGGEQGAKATFHAAAKGPAEQLKLGGS